jgi:hypothetical protein
VKNIIFGNLLATFSTPIIKIAKSAAQFPLAVAATAFSLLATEENGLLDVKAAIQRLHRGIYDYCEVTASPS